MTDRIDALDSLIEKIEAAEFNRWSVCGAPFTSPQKAFINYAYNGSLDAAKALHESVLPKHDADCSIVFSSQIQTYVTIWSPDGKKIAETCNESPARAWLLAILKSLRAEYHEKQANGGE